MKQESKMPTCVKCRRSVERLDSYDADDGSGDAIYRASCHGDVQYVRLSRMAAIAAASIEWSHAFGDGPTLEAAP